MSRAVEPFLFLWGEKKESKNGGCLSSHLLKRGVVPKGLFSRDLKAPQSEKKRKDVLKHQHLLLLLTTTTTCCKKKGGEHENDDEEK